MATFDADSFNSMFGEALQRGGDSLEKVAEVTGLYIQDRLRENSFAKKILPPQTVTISELTRNEEDEGLKYIDDLEPDSIAMRVNMRSEPEKTYIQGSRYSIVMGTISSDRFQKSEDELRSYRMPLTKVIEQNTVKDMQEQLDKTFMAHVRAGLMFGTIDRLNQLIDQGRVNHITASGKYFLNSAHLASYLLTRHVDVLANGGALAAGGAAIDATFLSAGSGHANYNPAPAFHSNIMFSDEGSFTRTVLRDLIKIGPARQMKTRVFLMHEYDWADTVGWLDSEAGLQITAEIVVSGYKYSTVAGYTFVTTVRDEPSIVQPGQIYAFPAPEFLGRHLVLDNVKFYINKEGRFFHMEAWETCGIGFGNIKGLGLIMLAGAEINLPNLFHTAAGVASNVTGEFTLRNDPTNPV